MQFNRRNANALDNEPDYTEDDYLEDDGYAEDFDGGYEENATDRYAGEGRLPEDSEGSWETGEQGAEGYNTGRSRSSQSQSAGSYRGLDGNSPRHRADLSGTEGEWDNPDGGRGDSGVPFTDSQGNPKQEQAKRSLRRKDPTGSDEGNGRQSRSASGEQQGRGLKRKQPVQRNVDDYGDDDYDDENSFNHMKREAEQTGRKAYEQAQKATNQAKRTVNQIKREMSEGLSDSMQEIGKLGCQVYLYAIFAYGFFVLGGLTSLVLLTAWVIAFEHSKPLMRMMLNVLALYIAVHVAYSVYNSAYALTYYVVTLPDFKIFDMLGDGLRFIDDLIDFAYDFLVVLIGVRGIALARKGKYIKIKWIEKLFTK